MWKQTKGSTAGKASPSHRKRYLLCKARVAFVGVVKSYKQGRKFFVRFKNGKKAMLPEEVYGEFKIGDEIEFQALDTTEKDWYQVDDTTKAVTITEKSNFSRVERATINVGYVSKIKTNANTNSQFVYLPNSTIDGKVTNVYVPLKAITDEHQELLRGHGALSADGQYVGNVFHLLKIYHFEPIVKENTATVALSELKYNVLHVSYATENRYGVILQADLPFVTSPLFEHFKDKFVGEVEITTLLRKEGRVKKKGDQFVEDIFWSSRGTPQYSFSETSIDEIKKIHRRHIADQEYEKLLDSIRKQKGFQSLDEVRKRFREKGHELSDEQLKEIFFHEGYNCECYEVLERLSVDTYVDHKSTVFIVNDNGIIHYIWEMPSRAAATYVFEDKLSIDELLSKLDRTRRMEIRQNKELQEALGFVGFVIHQEPANWEFLLKKLLESSVE